MNRFFYIIIALSFCFATSTMAATGITGDAQINQCEQKAYVITVTNDSGNDVSQLTATNDISSLVGFSFVSGTSDLTAPGCSTTVDPTVSGTDLIWDIDTLCGGITLSDGQVLTIEYELLTDCTAVSGSQNVSLQYSMLGNQLVENGSHSVEVTPGAVTIKKTPSVQPASVGDNVTWALEIKNSGLGTIKNVQVTDILGAGLQYVSDNSSGVNTAQETTWGPAQIASLASMDPEDTVVITLVATVIACDNLENDADVSWGCDLVTPCFDTANDGGTATASIQHQVKTPLLTFTPPDVSFNYCEDSVPVTFPISNTGDGDAYNVQTLVDFDPLSVSNVSAGASYDSGQKSFTLTDPIPPSGSYDLSFELTHSDWCTGTFPDPVLLWTKYYQDVCGNDFFPPVELSTITPPADRPTISVTKTGAPDAIQIGDSITYNITSSYSGATACGGGNTGTVTVTDTLPDGFTVSDAGGGTWVPGGDGTGGTITWTYSPPAALDTSITLESPGVDDCQDYCFTLFTNSVTAEVTDCCSCDLSSTDQQTTAIECEAFVSSSKTATPASVERCDTFTYTNTYVFDDDPALDTILLNALSFEEHAENNQLYVGGSLAVTLTGSGDITGCVGITDSTGGGSLVLDFSTCVAVPVRAQTLVISYELTATAATAPACSRSSFFSWSSLNLGSNPGGNDCLLDNTLHETTLVSVVPPAMDLTIGGLGTVINTCETKTVTLELSQSSAIANPRDVKLVLSGANYYVVDPATVTCGGSVSPVACVPVIGGAGDYMWTFNDNFAAAGANFTVTADMQKRCTGISALTATAYYDDLCTDDATPDELCSVSETEAPVLLTSGDLIIEKTPEVINALSNQVEWVIYLTNRGNGTAYNVWVDDVLGSGLIYQHGGNPVVVDDMTGVTINDSLDHSGNAINGVSIDISEMAPGERREITLTADLIDCSNLTNDVSASFGCISVDCTPPITDNSVVQIPEPNLVGTGILDTDIAPCSISNGTISFINAGQSTLYNVLIEQSLPAGISHIPGSTEWRLNGGAFGAAADPSPVNPMTWSSTELGTLAALAPGDKIDIRYELKADCNWNGGSSVLNATYENPCGDVFTSTDKVFSLALDAPEITLNKRLVPNDPVSCGQTLEWQIDVTNDSSHTLEVIRVEDTLGAGFTFDSASGTYSQAGQVITWEIADLAANATTTLTIGAITDSAAPSCSSDTDNTVRAWWGCGVVNGDPADADYDCLTNIAATGSQTPSREPDIAVASIGFSPGVLDSCDDSTTMTLSIDNTGPTDASNTDLVVTLPAGLSYNAGTAAIQCLGATTDPAADPAITGGGSILTFYDIGDAANNLCDTIQADGGNDTAILQFDVTSSCFTGGTINGDLRFYDCCGDTQYSASNDQNLTANSPDLVITKTPATGQVDCADTAQEWAITVTNNGTGAAQVVQVVDIPGDWLDVVFADSSANLVDMTGGQYGWEFNNLASGDSKTFTLATTLNPDYPMPTEAGCNASSRQNVAQTTWACGTGVFSVDGDPTTTSDYTCSNGTWVTTPATQLQMPDLQITAITPTISCDTEGTFNSSMTVTVENQGDGQTLANFSVSVTDGSWTGSGNYSGNLAAGASADITIDVTGWNPDCNNCTSYDLDGIVDFENDVCECDESNNTFSESYTVPIPKLALTAISPTPICNDVSSVDVVVVNQGCTQVAAGVEIAITGDATGTATTSGVLAAGGGSETVTVSLGNIACDQSYDITATVDPNDLVCECDGTNHTQSTTFSSPCCGIDLEKATNGDDADTPTGPSIPVGENVTWTYVITNTGSTTIDTISLIDDQRGNVTASCPGTSLVAGADMTCTVTTAVIAAMGDQYANVADVTGRPVDGSNNPVGNDLTDTDPSHFYVENPSIGIEKATNGEDADAATGPYIQLGDPVSWNYVVTNTGNVALTAISVVDDQGVAVTCPETILAVGANMTCTANGTAVIGQYTNNATVSGTPPNGTPVTDQDPSHYFGQEPSIDVEKATNGDDADVVTGPYVDLGDPVNWTYLVTNTGNVDLTAVDVVDDQGVAVTCPQNSLVVGESMTCTASGTGIAGQYANIATASGTPPVGPPVTDTDPSHYIGPLPAIDLEKSTNGEDADSPTGPLIGTGDSVIWTYEISNTGNTGLNNISLIDDQLGDISNSCDEGPIPLLAVGENFTCTVTGIATIGQYSNTADVEGEPVDNLGNPIAIPSVTDTDPSHYFGGTPSIEIEKATNGQDADSPTGPEITEGDTVNWSYVVTNSGDITLNNVQVTDDMAVTVNCPKSVLAAGESMTCAGSGVATTGQYRNEATVTGTPPTGPAVTDSDPSHYFGKASPTDGSFSIILEKDVNVNTVAGGDIVLYAVQITNPGPGQATSVKVLDTLPEGFLYIPGTSVLDGQRINDPTGVTTLIWIIDHVAAGQTRILQYQVRAPIDLSAGDYINTATTGRTHATASVSGVRDYDDCCLSVEKELLNFQPPVDIIPVQQDIYFYTDMAMYASWELSSLSQINLSQQDLTTWEYKISQHRQKVLEQATQTSRINSANLTMHSGLGLEMMYSPGVVGSDLSTRQETVQQKLKQLAAEVDWQGDYSSLRPLFLEFYGAVPIRRHHDDQHWDQQLADTRLSPAAWGLTLLNQSRELARLHQSDNPRDRFLAGVMAWQVDEKINFFWNWLQKQPLTNRYIPHLLAAKETLPLQLEIVDPDSHLFDQAAMLWGLSQLQTVLVTEDLPIPAKLQELSQQVWKNMEAHFDEDRGVWLSRIKTADTTEIDQEDQEQIQVFDILLASLATDALAKNDDSWVTFDKYSSRISAATEFLKQWVTIDGALTDVIHPTTEQANDKPATLLATSALVRMELLAGKQDDAILRFAAIEKLFWDQKNQLYHSDTSGDYQVAYDPFIIGTFIEMLRSLTDLDQHMDPAALSRGLAFVDKVVNQAELQLSKSSRRNENSLPIFAENEGNVRPLMPISQEDRNIENNHVPVLIRGVSLNLLPLAALPMDADKTQMHTGEKEQQGGFGLPKRILSRNKGHLLHTESAALSAVYLAETAQLLTELSSQYEDPFFVDPYGLTKFALSSDKLWKNSLMSIAFYYDQGISLNQSPQIIQLAKEKGRSVEQALDSQLDTLAEQYLDGQKVQLPAPIFLEYNQGEPFSSNKNWNWASRPYQEQMSLTGLSQLERSRLKFVAKMEGNGESDNSHLTTYLARVAAMQTAAKLEFLLDLLDTSKEQKLTLCPEAIEIIKDSRGQPLATHFASPNPTLVGQLSMLLAFADSLISPEGTPLSKQADLLTRVDHAFHQHIAEVVKAYGDNHQTQDRNTLLNQGIALDLLTQLHQHSATNPQEQEELLPLITARTSDLTREMGLSQSGGMDFNDSVAEMSGERNRLAANASALLALSRVQELTQDSELADTIGILARDFDSDLWSEKTGCYQGHVKQYKSREMEIVSYPYSDLDVVLPLAALSHSLKYLSKSEQDTILKHMTSFGSRLLGSPQLTSKILTDTEFTPEDFDSQIFQDTDIRLSNYQKPFAGDIIQYRIRVYNRCPQGQANASPLNTVDVKDILPEEMFYIPGSTIVDHTPSGDPMVTGNRLTWQIQDVIDVSEITFSAVLSADFDQRELRNRVEAVGWMGGERRSGSCDYLHEIIDPIGSRSSVITVHYYSDTNTNSIFETDELPIADIPTWLQGQSPVTSDQAGQATFRKLVPGSYLAQPDWQGTIEQYAATSLVPVETTVREYEEQIVDIGLIETSEITGWAFDDKNNNGKKDTGEPGIHGLRVQVWENDSFHAYSAVDGFFRIERIPGSKAAEISISSEQPYRVNSQGQQPAIEKIEATE